MSVSPVEDSEYDTGIGDEVGREVLTSSNQGREECHPFLHWSHHALSLSLACRSWNEGLEREIESGEREKLELVVRHDREYPACHKSTIHDLYLKPTVFRQSKLEHLTSVPVEDIPSELVLGEHLDCHLIFRAIVVVLHVVHWQQQ